MKIGTVQAMAYVGLGAVLGFVAATRETSPSARADGATSPGPGRAGVVSLDATVVFDAALMEWAKMIGLAIPPSVPSEGVRVSPAWRAGRDHTFTGRARNDRRRVTGAGQSSCCP